MFGSARAASMALLFAATIPTDEGFGVLYAPVAKTVSAPDFPHGSCWIRGGVLAASCGEADSCEP